MVAHKWSNSMNAIAKTCRPKEVIPIFPFLKFINFFHSSFIRHHLNTAARKQVAPCFPVVHRLTSARVYHGKRTISTELDVQTGPRGAHATGQRLRSRPGAGQFHRYFVPMLSRTHPDGRGGVSNRRPENNILIRRSKGALHSGGHPAFFAVGYIYVWNCQILRFQRGGAESGLAPLRGPLCDWL